MTMMMMRQPPTERARRQDRSLEMAAKVRINIIDRAVIQTAQSAHHTQLNATPPCLSTYHAHTPHSPHV
eukprot:2009835-Rhodomonas_salina.2